MRSVIESVYPPLSRRVIVAVCINCPDCGGEGTIYYHADTGEDMEYENWKRLPIEEQGREMCSRCQGTGNIEIED